MRLSLSFLGLALLASTSTAEAFVPRSSSITSSTAAARGGALNAATAAAVTEVPTSPIAGMRPGTSGLRKKVEVWQGVDDANKHYVENFIQSLVDTAKASEGGKLDT
jgi:phosphoglucomutase